MLATITQGTNMDEESQIEALLNGAGGDAEAEVTPAPEYKSYDDSSTTGFIGKYS